MLDTGVKITNSLSFVWLVEFRNYKWGTAGYNFDESYYTGKITDFSGVDENICRPEDNNITEKTISFSIPDENGRISASRGESVILRLIINDQQFLSWNFVVTSFTNYYNKANFNCSDFLSYLIEDVKYPKTDLVNPLDTSSATHSGSEDVCVPEIYGNPYIPLRSLLISSERAYILGPDDGSTYTIDSVSYPVEWDVKAEFLSSEYTFTQSSYNNLRVFVPYIASGGTAGFFQNSGSLLDMPTKVKKSTTQSITNPIDILASIFLNLGLTLSAIDSVSAAACAATYNTLGISLDVGLYQKEDAKNVISKILSACNSTINVYDKIYFKYLGDSSLATITKNDISNFSFSENILKNINDAGIAEYYETIQAGDPKQIYVPLTGETYSNSSTDTFKVEYLRDSVLVQQLARIYFRKKYWNSGSISFNAKKRYLSYECGDKITIQDDLYHNGDYFISSKKISDDLTLQFSCDMYLDDIGQILDYDPDPLTVISDVSGRIYYSDVAFKTTGYVNAGNCQIYGNTITKISGADSWTNAAARSTDSFVNSVKLTFKGSQVTANLAIGISTNPTALINYTSIDYCWMLKSNGTCEAFASGVSLGTYGTYTTSSVFSIGYDGYHIYFYIDEVLKYTVAGDVSYGLRFYLDSSFYSAGSKVTNVQWGPYSPSLSVVQAHADLARVTAEAYADGQVTLAEQRAIAEAQAKADLAETNAKAWADGKVTAEEQRAIQDAQAKADAAQAAAESNAKSYVDGNFVTKVLHQTDISNLQSQVDGQVSAWFYNYAPTTANAPASSWTTVALKELHADDTFTHLTTGQSWRWVYDGGVWKWVEIMDTATTAALSLAAQAQDTADGKRRVFVTQPMVPYDVGDLWTTATTLKRCVTAKTSAGSFAEGDWISAADVTDYLTIYDTAYGYANSAQAQALLDAQTYADGKFVTQVLHQAAVDNLQGQLDGQVIAWFYDYAPTLSNAPASLWTTEALRDQHANDTFTHLITGQSWRWVYDTGAWKWLEIADTATTAALAAASQAQDTADGKRRVFINQPVPPYDEGDLWADGTTLLRCVTPKTSTGSYAAGDWVAVATKAPQLPPDDDLFAHWDFDDTLLDRVSLLTPTQYGTGGYVGGISGRGRNFVYATKDYLKLPTGAMAGIANGTGFTLSLWFKADADQMYANPRIFTIAETNLNFTLGLLGAAPSPLYPVVRYANTVKYLPVAVSQGEWHHIVVRVNSLTAWDVTLWLDGVLCTNWVTGGITGNAVFNALGAYDGTGFGWTGAIDEVRVYNTKAITDDHVRALYLNPGGSSKNVAPDVDKTDYVTIYANAETFPAVVTPTTMKRTGSTFEKVGTTTAWDAQAYSPQRYAGGCRLAFKTGTPNKSFMMGFALDPTLSVAYTSTDYQFYLKSDATVVVYEKSTQRDIGNPVYTTDTLFEIIYDGSEVRYLMDGVVKRTVTGLDFNLSFCLDSSFYSAGSKATHVQWGPYSPPLSVVQARAELARTTAQAYADGEITAAEQRAIAEAQAKADLAETNANAYADGKVTAAEQRAIDAAQAKANLAETNAKAWADDLVTAEEARAIQDATAKANLAETNAKAWADGKITEAEQRAIDAAQAKATLAETNAKAWADGIVTAEEQRAIQDAQAKADAAELAAKEYADVIVLSAEQRAALDAQAKANLAETTAKAYANDEVTAAEQRAIADAQSKALMGHNLLNWYESWVPGTGNTGQFVRSSTNAENMRALAVGPFGQREIVWQSIPSGDGNADGGFNTLAPTGGFSVDPDKTYIYGCYMQRLTGNGSIYLGCFQVKNLSDVVNSNPYFANTSILNSAKWMLAIGVLHPRGYTGPATGMSGFYDVETGVKLVAGSDFKIDDTLADPTVQRMRAFQFYSTTGDGVTVEAQFARPFVMEASVCPPIDQLTGKLSTIASGADVTDYTTIYANTETFPAVLTPDVMKRTGSTFEKVGGTLSWSEAQAYSLQGYTGGCRLAFKAGSNTLTFMMGINTDPSTDASYTSVDYQFQCQLSGVVSVYQGATKYLIGDPPYTTDTLFEIIYDGSEIRYLMDGVTKRTVTGLEAGLTFYMDSSFASVGSKATHVQWGPYAPPLSVVKALALVAETEAKSFADGIVTDAEQRAIQDAQAKANAALAAAQEFTEGWCAQGADVTDYQTIYDTAQGYAETAQTQAEANAMAYADSQFVTQVIHQTDINSLQNQLDGQVMAWFYNYAPTTANAPANLWTTEALKDQHANDTFTRLDTGQSWRWVYTAGVWGWTEIADTATTAALAAAAKAQDTADNKRRVFVATPTVPYDVGDLWTSSSTLFRCVVAKTTTGSYVAGDWMAVADKTDYANTETFPVAITPDLMVRRGSTFERVAGSAGWLSQAYSANKYTGGCRVAFRAGSVDKAMALGINTDPALNVALSSIDYCFYLQSNATAAVYESGTLRAIGTPSYTTNTLFEIIYDGAEVRYLMDGVVVRTVSGLANNLTFYMDSSFYIIGGKVTHVEWGPYGPTLSVTQTLASTAEANAKSYVDGNFVTKVLHTTDISNLQSQVDGQVSAWFYSYAPTTANAPASSWTTVALKEQHANDTFTHLTTGQSWRWVNTAGVWGWTEIADTATVTALAAAAQAQDTADNKRRVFVATPTVPYDIGDLWTTGSTISRCVTAKTTAGSYAAGDWVAVADATNYDDYRVSNVKTENSVTTIARPVGGTYYNNGASVTGAIKITLPQSWTSTMIKFGVDIRQYNTTKSFTLQLGGYTYIANSAWINSFAQLAGSTASNNRVRFGHDGTKCCILIGDVTSVWNIPAVVVKDFQASYSNYTRDKWETGWAISIVTDISGITTTADISDTLIDAKSILGQGALATQSTADYGTQVTGTKPPANADSTTTVIGAGLITTGFIGNKGKEDPLLTLGINFDTAEILVGAAAGLKIKSGGGITVESGGGITVKDGGGITVESGGAFSLDSGGDLILTAGYGDPSKIKFMRSSADANPMLIYGGIDDFQRSFLYVTSTVADTASLRLGLTANRLRHLSGVASSMSFDTGDLNTGLIGFSADNVDGGFAKISSTGPIYASGLRAMAECSCTSQNEVGIARLMSSDHTWISAGIDVKIEAPVITITGATPSGVPIYAPVRTTDPTAAEVPENHYIIYRIGTTNLRISMNVGGTMQMRYL